MQQLTQRPESCPVCTSDEVAATSEGDGGYPVATLLPVVACAHCGWAARMVHPEDQSDPLDVDELRARAARARIAHPEWDHLDLREQVVGNGWAGDPAPAPSEVVAWACELSEPWRSMAPTGPDVILFMERQGQRDVRITPVGMLPAEGPGGWVGERAMPSAGGVITTERLLRAASEAYSRDGTTDAARDAVRREVSGVMDQVRESTLAAVTARWEAQGQLTKGDA